ncbi:MAG: hypothetical protein IJO41_05950 [Oscillospiraceae bacterium]|nr:hypothetical protein [Oscillospiraceae bacterium]
MGIPPYNKTEGLFGFLCLSLRQKSSIFATSLVRGRQGTVCHRPRRGEGIPPYNKTVGVLQAL